MTRSRGDLSSVGLGWSLGLWFFSVPSDPDVQPYLETRSSFCPSGNNDLAGVAITTGHVLFHLHHILPSTDNF